MAAKNKKARDGRRELPKCPTGIEGLDEITGGGLPRGRATLVCGSAGCGKSLMGMEFLVRGVTQFNEPGVLMTFEEPVRDVAQNVASLGFDLDDLVARKKMVLDHVRDYLVDARTDPTNLARRPVPTRVTINTGIADIESKVKYSALYLQDQWTQKRFTLSAAVRYDHATSNYLGTCIGPDLYVPVQNGGTSAGSARYCTPPTDGVSYNDITPRWGAAWDVFGNGKTSVKWNMGKYLAGAGISGIYADANPALRAVNELTRTWTDTNGNRRVDCNLLNFNQNGECGTPLAGQDSVRFGRDPLSLDAAGIPIGLATTQCGRREQGIPADVQAYCAAYGNSLLDGSGKRRAEWQFGLGIQHEILPRLSAEVTYNRRKYSNLTVTDPLGVGCDRFNGAQALQTCLDAQRNYVSGEYDFFRVVAPANPGLPGGGGYTVRGIANQKPTFPVGRPSAVK